MITTIHIETRHIKAYAAIHPIVIKANVIKRVFFLTSYHATIRTRKGDEMIAALNEALQKAKIPASCYRINIIDTNS